MDTLKNFFCLEGIDGSGKTTLAKAIVQYSSEFQFGFEPTDGVFGKQIRSILKDEQKGTKKELYDLFIKDREEHQVWINSQVDSGYKVILDRYILSSMAYQSLDEDMNLIFERNRSFFIPQMTFFLDIQPKLALERRYDEIKTKSQPQEFFETSILQEKIYENYQNALLIFEKQGIPFKVLDATKNPSELLVDCMHYINQISS